MHIIIAFLAGLLMSAGIIYSQMINPTKVLTFLTLNQYWDPSLLLVMATALLVYSTGFYFIKKRRRPFCAAVLHLPKDKKLDKSLLTGATVFGIGWGLIGYCPGPALISLTSGNPTVLLFVSAMVTGWFIAKKLPIN